MGRAAELEWRKIPELFRLKELASPPKKLFSLGSLKADIFRNCVAVVGSRRMTEYGRRALETIVPRLVFEGKTVISGFMYGVDQYAHELCIENGGKTIAVLGWGINLPFKGSDIKLAEKIIKSQGLILSEWEEQQGTLWTFPTRNRIVAALADEIIVVEAAAKSGALITARLGAKLKRKIWAVPGPITSRTSEGTNALIAAGLAQMWLGNSVNLKIDYGSDPLLNLLENESLTANEIARKMNKNISEIGAQLSLLTLEGSLTERDGKYFVNNAG